MHRIRIRLGTLLLFIVTLAAALGGLLGEKVSAETPLEEGSQKLLKTFTEVLATVQQNYADKTKSGVLVGNAIRGMLRTLDPHSSYFSTEDYDRLQEEQKGKYYGLGITIRSESPGSGRVVVVEPPAPGTPAYKAGLHAGDVIAKIEMSRCSSGWSGMKSPCTPSSTLFGFAPRSAISASAASPRRRAGSWTRLWTQSVKTPWRV
ncbi:MAG: PDZ domain-containing protein [Acidobacteriota bacterium]